MRRGKPITSSLQHLVYFPERTSDNYSTIVAMHGRGTDEYDLIPLVESLGFDVLLIAPRAPRIFQVGAGYAWYDFSEEGVPDPRSFRESVKLLQEFLLQVRRGYPIDPEGPILLGFSQGAVMSYAAGLLDPTHIRGIVALSGYVPNRSNLPIKWDDLKGLPVFASHGLYDELIPVELGRGSAELLQNAGANVTFKEYRMGHQVTDDVLRELTIWMREVLR